jgi:hypothetical protein
MEHHFVEFENARSSKLLIIYIYKTRCAFVIPTFELDECESFPLTKKTLIDAWYRDMARPFHESIYQPGHFATDYAMY